MTSTLIRRTALVLTAAALPLLAASPAVAEVPEGWSNPDEVGLLQMLLLIGALPIALAVVIALAVYLPALARGENVRPRGEAADEWFGGPRSGPAELESRESGTTGGASGSW
ncbi:MAG: hypothetical protein ACXWDM_12965 [Nocardioides sp.]